MTGHSQPGGKVETRHLSDPEADVAQLTELLHYSVYILTTRRLETQLRLSARGSITTNSRCGPPQLIPGSHSRRPGASRIKQGVWDTAFPPASCDLFISLRKFVLSMALPNPIQQLYDLDKSSPQFHGQLSNLIHGQEYREHVSHLRGEDLARLVEYLDSVSFQIIFPPGLLPQRRRRFSIVSILWHTRSGHPYVNSKEYAAPMRYYRGRAHFQALSRSTNQPLPILCERH